MRCFLAGSLLVCFFGVVAVSAADEPMPPGKVVSLEILVADLPEGPAPTAAAILDMEKAGKLERLARFRLTGLENEEASLQFGEMTPIVSGRTIRGGGGPGGGFPGGGNIANYTQVSVGTHLTTISRVESADAVVTNLKIQRSSVSPPQAADDPNAPPQGTVTLTIQSTVRTKPGEPLLVTGRQVKGGKEAAQTWVVLTSHVAAAPAAAAPAAAANKQTAAPVNDETLKILQLFHASAPAMANILNDVLNREQIIVAVDQRTNALVLRGEPGALEVARALIMRLDTK